MAREVLLDRRARERDILSAPAVDQLLDAAARGVHGSGDVVWSLVNLELWLRTYVDGEGVQTLPAPVKAARTGAADPQLVAS